MTSESLVGYVVLAAVAAAAGLIRGFSGFGAGLVMAPIYFYLLGPARAVPILILLDMIASVQLVPRAVRLTRWKTIAPLGLAGCLMIPVGRYFLTRLDATLMLRAVSGVVLTFAIVLALGWRYRRQPSVPVSAAVGAAGGLLAGAGGIGGPPVVLYLLSGPDAAPENRSGIISYVAITHTMAMIVFAATGLLNLDVLFRAVILAPVFLVTIHLGSRLFGRSTDTLYRRLALGFLAAVAVAGLVLGSTGAS